jgi:uncharacterized protein
MLPGLTTAQARVVKKLVQQHVPGVPVAVFGSRALGTHKVFSDLDLLIQHPQPLPLETIAALKQALAETDLPFRVDVAETALLEPDFAAAIAPQLRPL